MAQQRFQVFKTDVMFLTKLPGPLLPQLMDLQLCRSLQAGKDQSADQHVESNEQKEQAELSGVSARLQGRAAKGAPFLHPLVVVALLSELQLVLTQLLMMCTGTAYHQLNNPALPFFYEP